MQGHAVIIFDLDPQGGVGGTLRGLLSSDPEIAVKYHIVARTGTSGGAGEFSLALSNCTADAAFAVVTRDSFKVVSPIFSQGSGCTWSVPLVLVLDAGAPTEVDRLLDSGIRDFIITPLEAADVVPRLSRLLKYRQAEDACFQALKETLGLREFVGQSHLLISELRKIAKVGPSEASVFILGESGTGKELCARAIHYLSPRAEQPFIPVNCGAIPTELVENELFGHEAGAFTGASNPSLGLVQEAEGGTLFLDEVDSLPLLAQVKLLRLLQEKEYRRLGSRKLSKADVRVLAATNRNLPEALACGRFRSDLYYRLNTVTLSMPALRDRVEDIPPLACSLLKKLALQYGKPARGFHSSAIQKLVSYDWPGNVRELENVVARSLLLSEEETLCAANILVPDTPTGSSGESLRDLKARFLAQFERNYVTGLLLAFGSNITRAAIAAHKNRRAFWELIRKYHITVERTALPA